MHFSTLVAACLTPSALGLALPQFDSANSVIVQSFDVPGSSQELGFIIPKNTPNGAYSVYIDSDGVAHHTRLENPEALEPTDDDESRENSSGPVKRQGWQVTCPNYVLNRAYTDSAVGFLKQICRNGSTARPGAHIYVYYGNVAAYFCNFSSSTSYVCHEWQIREQLQENVSRTCGAYYAGWSTWERTVSIGQQYVTDSLSFCGRDH